VTVENTAPTVSAVAVRKTAGGTDGYVGPTGYVVYADAADNLGGSGLDLLTADVSQLGGSTAATLTACSVSCTVAGHAYGFKTGTLTVSGGVADGSKTVTVTATDVAGNTGSLGSPVTADSTAPAASDIQTANGGTTAGKMDAGDTITYSFSEPMEPNSILAGWDGSAQAVKVKVSNGQGNPAGRNRLTVTTTTDAAIALGSVNLTQEYASADAVLTGSMVRTGNTVVITLGTLSSGTLATVATAGTMAWTPSALATDLAGNALPTTVRNETTPPADVEF
jgi:hypothetical protein